MSNEQRIGEAPVPGNFEEALNQDQLHTLKRMEAFGWRLKFIRRPLVQDVVPILIHSDNNQYGTLEEDGTLNLQPDIKIR